MGVCYTYLVAQSICWLVFALFLGGECEGGGGYLQCADVRAPCVHLLTEFKMFVVCRHRWNPGLKKVNFKRRMFGCAIGVRTIDMCAPVVSELFPVGDAPHSTLVGEPRLVMVPNEPFS